MSIIVLVSDKYSSWTLLCYLTYLDINECDNDNGGCTHTCINQPGSYQCQCGVGFNSENNGKNCTGNINLIETLKLSDIKDINECDHNNGGCEQLCTNTNGSFQCSCYSGFSGDVFCSG